MERSSLLLVGGGGGAKSRSILRDREKAAGGKKYGRRGEKEETRWGKRKRNYPCPEKRKE